MGSREEDQEPLIEASLVRCRQARLTFVTLSEMWGEVRREAATTLREVADRIDGHHKNVNIASLTGTGSSIAGGAAALGGLLLAPYSGGLSLALSAGGVVGTVAGSATTLGASIAEVYLTGELAERASGVLEADAFYTRALRDALREVVGQEREVLARLGDEEKDLKGALETSPALVLVERLCSEGGTFLRGPNDLLGNAPTLSGTLSSSSDFFQAMKEVSALQSSSPAASMSGQVLSAGLGAVFVALDVYHLVKTSENLERGSETRLARRMREVAEELDRELEHVQRIGDLYRRDLSPEDEKTLTEIVGSV